MLILLSNFNMKVLLIAFSICSIFAFFASAKMLPLWVHRLNSQGYDKHAHFLIFCVLQVICCLNFRDFAPLSIAAFLCVIGMAVEVFQGFLGRNACILDVFSNCAGLFFALIFIQLFNIFKFS